MFQMLNCFKFFNSFLKSTMSLKTETEKLLALNCHSVKEDSNGINAAIKNEVQLTRHHCIGRSWLVLSSSSIAMAMLVKEFVKSHNTIKN